AISRCPVKRAIPSFDECAQWIGLVGTRAGKMMQRTIVTVGGYSKHCAATVAAAEVGRPIKSAVSPFRQAGEWISGVGAAGAETMQQAVGAAIAAEREYG